MNAATKYVATHRPANLGWGPAQPLGGDLGEGIRELKASPGPDLILAGTSTLTPLLFRHGLVDEVVLNVYPVLLGAGKRLLADLVDAQGLAFVSTMATPAGVLLNTYRCIGALGK